MSSIKTTYVAASNISPLDKHDPKYFFTMKNGGLNKHGQPLMLDKTQRKEWCNTFCNPGPGAYNPAV
jgi:hypothetical protein